MRLAIAARPSHISSRKANQVILRVGGKDRFLLCRMWQTH